MSCFILLQSQYWGG